MAVVQGKRAEIGLGSVDSIPLATARRLAGEMREAVALGQDPRAATVAESPKEETTVPTFGAFADTYISNVEAGCKNAVHRQQWRQSLRDHAALLHDKPIDAIDTDDVLAVLRPIWLTKGETASRVRGRIEKILDAAKARDLRARDAANPAAFRGHLALLLPPRSKLERGHHAALPWKNAPDFMKQLRERKAVAARCLEFTIVTAARSGEALGAMWSEIDPNDETWTIPASRMKAGAKHTVPLSTAASNLLKGIMPEDLSKDQPIFAVGGARRSNMAMAMLLRRMDYGHITTHGFRSTFRDWAGDDTEFPRELIEQALAHTISSKAERAYRRGTAIERRRELMEAWAKFLG
jgi:integrase